jgi:hypothetical protein
LLACVHWSGGTTVCQDKLVWSWPSWRKATGIEPLVRIADEIATNRMRDRSSPGRIIRHALAFAGVLSPWQNLNFLPVPHGQGA